MPWDFSTFLATRICSSRLARCGEPAPPLDRQVPMRELQAAVVAVTGVDGPVAARLAGSDRIPVHAVRIRGAGRRAPSGPQRAPRRWWPAQTSCGCSSTSILSPSARHHHRARDTQVQCLVRRKGWVAPSRSGTTGEAAIASPGVRPGSRRRRIRLPQPHYTQVRGFEIICSVWSCLDRTNHSHKVISVSGASHADHGMITADADNRPCRSAVSSAPRRKRTPKCAT